MVTLHRQTVSRIRMPIVTRFARLVSAFFFLCTFFPLSAFSRNPSEFMFSMPQYEAEIDGPKKMNYRAWCNYTSYVFGDTPETSHWNTEKADPVLLSVHLSNPSSVIPNRINEVFDLLRYKVKDELCPAATGLYVVFYDAATDREIEINGENKDPSILSAAPDYKDYLEWGKTRNWYLQPEVKKLVSLPKDHAEVYALGIGRGWCPSPRGTVLLKAIVKGNNSANIDRWNTIANVIGKKVLAQECPNADNLLLAVHDPDGNIVIGDMFASWWTNWKPEDARTKYEEAIQHMEEARAMWGAVFGFLGNVLSAPVPIEVQDKCSSQGNSGRVYHRGQDYECE